MSAITAAQLAEDLTELSAAEEFLDYFAIPFDAAIVHVNRLHILQRLHNYLAAAGDLPSEGPEAYLHYQRLLQRAYSDFVHSDAQSEKVFRVFHMHEPQVAVVPLSAIRRGVIRANQP
jgi:nitrogenase-stabilizing/protective protein